MTRFIVHERGDPPERNQILLAEDDPSTTELLQTFLEEQGFSVIAVHTGSEALRRLEKQHVDLVLSDLSMPEGDGFELVARVRDMGLLDLPFILMSANYESVLRVKGLKLGADDFVLKPIDLNELSARIEAQLRRSDRQTELARATVLDPLTETLNRRGLVQHFEGERRKRTDPQQHVAALLIDIDDFKTVNDTYGHAAGDLAIKTLSEALKQAVRVTDHVCRIGGDEFVVLLPDADEANARQLAKRVLDVSPLEVTLPAGTRFTVAFSLGVSVATWEKDLASLLARADAEMYQHKRQSSSTARH